MIVVDTSAVVAIVFAEPEREMFLRALQGTDRALISTVSVVEARMVVHGRRGQRAVVLLDDILRLPMFDVVAPGLAEMDAAYAAFVAFGKGSGHPAGLNFGDVFSYALAKVRALPLLFKGEDFSQTDIASACVAPS
ncbi:type II toxin-antitoxin system VapC family toxin [uncultured Thiodictyon sp.]|uniref:type II toxin-antitoxin system VapC family toxin n=1 Tax=uncultured Thiodictyon sp. TaxID=1846217 RepID=UPI0025D72203|nr:type II toxin-antitoxin system VapC family toxin [uncultured Thiodictyon sp.]